MRLVKGKYPTGLILADVDGISRLWGVALDPRVLASVHVVLDVVLRVQPLRLCLRLSSPEALASGNGREVT